MKVGTFYFFFVLFFIIYVNMFVNCEKSFCLVCEINLAKHNLTMTKLNYLPGCQMYLN